MRIRSRVRAVGASTCCAILMACSSGSNGVSPTLRPGTFGVPSDSQTLSGVREEDCGSVPLYDANAKGIARFASRNGITVQPDPVDALRAALVRGSEPYFGGRGGAGLVGLGYPAQGWREVSATKGHTTFRAPLLSGTARVTLTYVGSRWLVSHLEKDC